MRKSNMETSQAVANSLWALGTPVVPRHGLVVQHCLPHARWNTSRQRSQWTIFLVQNLQSSGIFSLELRMISVFLSVCGGELYQTLYGSWSRWYLLLGTTAHESGKGLTDRSVRLVSHVARDGKLVNFAGVRSYWMETIWSRICDIPICNTRS